MRKHAALADQFELPQTLKKRRADFGAFANQHQYFGVAETLGQHAHVLHVVIPDRDVVAGQLAETRQAAQRIEVVVEDGDLQRPTDRRCASTSGSPASMILACVDAIG